MLPATVEKRTKTGVRSADFLEGVGSGEVAEGLGALKVAMGAIPSGVDDPLGDPLMIEVEDLLPEVKVLQRSRAPLPDAERVLVVTHHDALLSGKARPSLMCGLVSLAALRPPTPGTPARARLLGHCIPLSS